MDPPDSDSQPLALSLRSPFVARSKELTYIAERVEAASRNEGGLILISGEPGVGKTSLMLEAATQAESKGWRILIGHAYDSQGMPPYLPLVEALEDYVRDCPVKELAAQVGDGATDIALLLPTIRRRLPDIPADRIDVENAHYRLGESFSEFVGNISRASAPQGLILCIDDLHWANDSTLTLLEHLIRRLASAPVLILATYRDTDLDVAMPLTRTLEQLTRQRLSQRLDIKRFSQEEVRSMLAAIRGLDPPPSLVESIYNETEGNPFFTQEVFSYLEENDRLFDEAGNWRPALAIAEGEVPQGVRLVIGRRLERLSDEARQVLAFASALGRTFSYDLLRAVVNVEEEALLAALDELERAHLLMSETRGLTFAHELIRQSLLSGLSLPRRQQLHLRAAAALEEQYAGRLDSVAAELAEHNAYSTAPEDVKKTVQYGRMAAHGAMGVSAHQEAVHLLDRAIEAQQMLDPDDNQSNCDLQLQLGEALLATGEHERVLEKVGPEALALSQAMNDGSRAFAACRLVLEVPAPPSPYWVEMAERYLGDDPQVRIWFNLKMTGPALNQNLIDKARALLDEAITLAREVGDVNSQLRVAAWSLRGGIFPAAAEPSRFQELKKLLEEVRSRPRAGLSPQHEADASLDALIKSLAYADRRAAEAERRELEELAARSKHNIVVQTSRAAGMLFAMLEGRLQELLEQDISTQYGTFPFVWRQRVAGWVGDQAALAEGVAWTERYSGRLPPVMKPSFLAQQGKLSEARNLLGGLPEVADGKVLRALNFGLQATILETAALTGDTVSAPAILEELKDEPRRFSNPYFVLVPRHRARLESLVGDFDRARATYAEVIEFCETISYRPELALCRLELAELLLGHFPSERPRALHLLDLAIGEFESMAMTPSYERALRLRGRRRLTADPKTPAYPDGLSQREVEVLRLLAAGRSNQQIADELVISLNTVTHHVTNIFNKSGAANRTEAAAYAHRTGLN